MKLGIIGLGYVGLPLARLFATRYPVVGFDINRERVRALQEGEDTTLEVSTDLLRSVLRDSDADSPGLYCTDDPEALRKCDHYIVTVPTPVDKDNRPDLGALLKSSATVGKFLSKDNIVIYESTVFPGATEEVCIPVLERESGLQFNVDFFAGYSPERINPGDKTRTIEKIRKVTSGSTPEIAAKVDSLYASVIDAGTHSAPSIKVAEAAKVIENAQRDINIAFVNELSKIFNILEIDTQAVLEAAETKWNFLPFRPGLVGGHCIGVDPYYLAQRAIQAGYHPEIILAGRRLNDSMGGYVASQVIKLMLKKTIPVLDAEILVMGFTFKENCPDVRNTKIADVVAELREYGVKVNVFDPWADPSEVRLEYGIAITNSMPNGKYDAIVAAVAHKEFETIDISEALKPSSVLYDIKWIYGDRADGKL